MNICMLEPCKTNVTADGLLVEPCDRRSGDRSGSPTRTKQESVCEALHRTAHPSAILSFTRSKTAYSNERRKVDGGAKFETASPASASDGSNAFRAFEQRCAEPSTSHLGEQAYTQRSSHPSIILMTVDTIQEYKLKRQQ